jgi:PAS domain S-box-containing protein
VDFVTQKDGDLIPYVLSQILDTTITGITLSDPDLEDNPIVYANEAFELMSGYEREEILGKNCRFLQGTDRDQEAVSELREAIARHEEITVTLRNYRKDGTMFYNRLTVRPLFDRQGQLIYYLGVQHDVTNELEAERELKRLNDLLAKSARSGEG